MNSEWQYATFGDSEEWKNFERQNQAFLQRFGNLRETIEIVAKSRFQLEKMADRVLYFLCQQCIEDFSEILLLSGNGYGTGAQRILRTMYEHAVTILYLASHQEEAEAFIDYFWVQEQKLTTSILQIFGQEVIPEQKVSEISARYKEVKKRFTIADCEKCGTKRVNHTWNKLDLVSMARKAGEIGKLVVQAYYLPLLQSHPSIRSLSASVKSSDSNENELIFDFSGQHLESRLALSTAHALLIMVFDCFGNYFTLPHLLEKVAVCTEDLRFAWAAGTQ